MRARKKFDLVHYIHMFDVVTVHASKQLQFGVIGLLTGDTRKIFIYIFSLGARLDRL